ADFPPMVLQSLVENAIKHGLEPKPEGGALSVEAEVAHGKLVVSVADTGVGFGRAATAGTGTGLNSIRERLKLIYGPQAELRIAERPDVVFLDIRMPAKSGIEAAREIAALPRESRVPEIVFVTAYDQYAIDAFEQGVIDYVLKPAERERLALTVERIRKRLAAPMDDAQGALQQALERLAGKLEAPSHLRWIQASVGQQIQMIPVEEVLFFISDEKYTRVQTAQQEALIRTPIRELIAALDPAQFWQIHRSTLINARAIAGI